MVETWLENGNVKVEIENGEKIHVYTDNTKRLTISENGILTLLSQGAVRTRKASDQTLASADTWYVLTMSDLIDPQNQWDSANNKFVAKEDGVYLIYAKARFKVNSDGDELSIRIYNITSATVVARTSQYAPTIYTQDIMVMDILSLNANDEIRFEVKNTDNSDTISGGANYTTYAFIVKVS